MIYRLAEVVKAVRVALDEYPVSVGLTLGEDPETLELDDIIRQKVEEAVRRVHSAAPAFLLEEGHNFGEALHWRGDGSGWTMLPDDFMRLVVFEMSDWERPVWTAISGTSPEYGRQRSRFKGIRGTAQRPVCAIVTRPEGKALEFYSCKTEGAQVVRAVYIPYPKVDADGGIDISERCYEAVVYTAAGLTAITYGEHEKGERLIELGIRS